MSDVKRIELAKKIRLAFKKVEHPERKIGDKEEMRDWLDKRWKDVTADDLNRNDTLIFFSGQALRYYLPVYLFTILEQPTRVSSHIRETLIRELGESPVANLSFCKTFSDAQKQVILEFLEGFTEFFPFQTEAEIQKFSKGLQHLARKNIEKQQEKLKRAIEFWKSCL